MAEGLELKLSLRTRQLISFNEIVIYFTLNSFRLTCANLRRRVADLGRACSIGIEQLKGSSVRCHADSNSVGDERFGIPP